MQYQEFLRLAGVTEREVTRLDYRAIERLYMERDDLFPDKDAAVTHYRRFGWRGFSKDFVRHLDALRDTVHTIERCYPYTDYFDGMLDIALALSGRV